MCVCVHVLKPSYTQVHVIIPHRTHSFVFVSFLSLLCLIVSVIHIIIYTLYSLFSADIILVVCSFNVVTKLW